VLGCTMDESTLRQSIRKLIDIDNEVYSTRMAFLFCLALSAFLWWIPLLGPAVAGYVCGRKAGSMMKGMACSLLAGILLLLLVKALSFVVLGEGGFPIVPADDAAGAFRGSLGTVPAYLQSFFAQDSSQLNYSALGIAVVFGGVGGMLSRQARKETEQLISRGATECAVRPMARSIQLYNAHKEMGFKTYDDCIEMQRMTTNKTDAGEKPKAWKDLGGKAQERAPVTTTVQTVTTTVSGTAATAKTKAQGSPFTDILEKSDQKKGN